MPETDIKSSSHIFPSLRWHESYVSFLLGVGVVVFAVIAIFLTGYFKNIVHTAKPLRKEVSSTKTVNLLKKVTHSNLADQKNGSKELSKTYVVQSGDSLWHIAEAQLGSGYKWTDIAKKNNLVNPGLITSGMKLTLPQAAADVKVLPTLAQQPVITIPPVASNNATITGTTYTVQHGDTMWDIADRAYHDSFRWVEIAQKNNLANPRVIHAGNVLAIPRNNNP